MAISTDVKGSQVLRGPLLLLPEIRASICCHRTTHTCPYKKDQRFVWSPACEEAFQRLKFQLTSAPILALPNDKDLYILDTDASGEAIGAVLSQVQYGNERVICYGSRLCSQAESNYDVTRKELLAVIFFLKEYRQYLL